MAGLWAPVGKPQIWRQLRKEKILVPLELTRLSGMGALDFRGARRKPLETEGVQGSGVL